MQAASTEDQGLRATSREEGGIDPRNSIKGETTLLKTCISPRKTIREIQSPNNKDSRVRAKRDGLTSHERLIKPRATRRSVIRTRQSGHATWDPFWSHGGGGGGWFYLDKPVQFALDVGFERGKKNLSGSHSISTAARGQDQRLESAWLSVPRRVVLCTLLPAVTRR